MGQILVRNIDDKALQNLRSRAQAQGQSLEATIRDLIENAGKPSKSEILEEMRSIRAMTKGIVPSLTLDEIREGLE